MGVTFSSTMRDFCVKDFANKEGVDLLEDLILRVKAEVKRKEEEKRKKTFLSDIYVPISFEIGYGSINIKQNGKSLDFPIHKVRELVDFLSSHLKGEKNA